MFLALTGSIYAGKTKLARCLGKRGYTVVSFTDLLKQYAVEALSACGLSVTLKDILEDKKRYRPLLQELGSAIGFNDNPKYVYEALRVWRGENVVFDNARTYAQEEVLRRLGFILVELQISEEEQLRRAERLGVKRDDLRSAQAHAVEGLLRGRGDIILNGEDSPDLNVVRILEGEKNGE